MMGRGKGLVMSRYEYDMVTIEEPTTGIYEIVETLNRLDEDNWELVTVSCGEFGYSKRLVHLYLRREKKYVWE